jgi:hypothetical protein
MHFLRKQQLQELNKALYKSITKWHTIFLNYRSSAKKHNQQIWSKISQDMIFGIIFTFSRKGFLLNLKIHSAQTATRTPFLHPGSAQRDRQAGPQVKGTPPVSQAEPGRCWPVGSRWRRGLRPSQGDRRALHPRVNLTVPVAWPKELGKPAATVHGGAAVRVVAGETSPATAWWVEALGSIRDTLWCSCARKEGGRWSRKEVSTERSFSGENVRALASNLWG